MKKLSAIFVALLLVAATAVSAFAAGINDNEQKVLDEIKTSVTLKGVEMVWPDSYVNQAESYLNTVDLTAEEADAIIAAHKEAQKYLEGTGAENISKCTVDQKKELLNILQKGASAVGGSATYAKPTVTVTVKGDVVLKIDNPDLVAKSAAGSKDAGKTDSGVVKTTGAGVDYTVVLFGAAIALVAVGGTLFVVKTKKA